MAAGLRTAVVRFLLSLRPPVGLPGEFRVPQRHRLRGIGCAER